MRAHASRRVDRAQQHASRTFAAAMLLSWALRPVSRWVFWSGGGGARGWKGAGGGGRVWGEGGSHGHRPSKGTAQPPLQRHKHPAPWPIPCEIKRARGCIKGPGAGTHLGPTRALAVAWSRWQFSGSRSDAGGHLLTGMVVHATATPQLLASSTPRALPSLGRGGQPVVTLPCLLTVLRGLCQLAPAPSLGWLHRVCDAALPCTPVYVA